MKTNNAIWIAGVLTAILASECHANLNGSDDFNDNSKDPARWGPDFTSGGVGLLIETNGRLEFTTSGVPNPSTLVVRPWILNFGSYTQSWEVHIDASVPHLGFPESLFGLGVALGTNGDFNNMFSIDLFESSTEGRLFLMKLKANGGSDERVKQVATTSTFAGLRIAFDANTKVLSAYYDEDGPNSGYSWTLLGSTNISTAWSMTSTSVFAVWVSGRVEETNRFVISTDNLFGDNFYAFAAWQGTDDFSSAIYSSTNWTFTNEWLGQMTGQITNGHASFLDPISTISHQRAGMVWNGKPTATEGWMVDILGHNTVPYGDGGSTLYFVVMDTEALASGEVHGFGVGMGQHSTGASFGSLWIWADNGGSTNPVVVPCTNNMLFGLRLVYYPTSQTIQAWYDPTGSGSAWTRLDSITVSQMSVGMTATSTFSFFIVGETFFGPVSEGQMWADNFRAMPTPPPLLVADAQRLAGAEVLHLTWMNNGSMCLLESAGALTGGWSTVSTPWTTNASWVSTTVTNPSPAQFYRLRAN